MREILFGESAVLALVSWFAWNVIMLSMHKDEDEKGWNLPSYCSETWDNWLASLALVPVLLLMGKYGIGLDVTDVEHIKWSDTYYVLSGFLVEVIRVVYKKWRSKNKE